MSKQAVAEEDPLVAALPPASDYLTYLTLLEYQLRPSNLSTLCRLLAEDDGTLAQEIGWDLLKLVLPMLGETTDAKACLDLIARRGNPREVVVRVAESLEALGKEHDDENDPEGVDEEYQEDEEDELQTFPGEATRIHLGTMTLDGLPPTSTATAFKTPAEAVPKEQKQVSEDAESHQAPELCALLSMLGTLHPRIKTQHPSRFLATSLPAALGAYRRCRNKGETTSAFIAFLGKLSGKQRPQLPPRTSTAFTAQQASVTIPEPATSSVPLPDSEGQANPTETKAPSEEDNAVGLQLLQAVMLEVLDEYLTSFQHQDPSHFSWCTRLRETYEPNRTVPGRLTELERWQSQPHLQERDHMMAKFVRLSRDLGLDVNTLLAPAFANPDDVPEVSRAEEGEVEESEFPTKPSQIPLSISGIFFVHTATQIIPPLTSLSKADHLRCSTPVFPHLYNIYNHITSSSNRTYINTVDTTQDALLALLYLSHKSSAPSNPAATEFTNLLTTLLTFCLTCPDPSLRSSAHATATILFHTNPSPDRKLNLITTILTSSETPEPKIHAVVVDWLKDEFLNFISHSNSNNQGTNPSLLAYNGELTALLFPRVQNYLQTAKSNAHLLASILAVIPFYIAILNLICIIHASIALRDACSAELLATMGKTFHGLEGFSRDANELIKTDGHYQEEGSGVSVVDIWALQDAIGRALIFFPATQPAVTDK